MPVSVGADDGRHGYAASTSASRAQRTSPSSNRRRDVVVPAPKVEEKAKKKKKKRRTFGDETAVAVDKRDRRIEKAVEKGVRKRETTMARREEQAQAEHHRHEDGSPEKRSPARRRGQSRRDGRSSSRSASLRSSGSGSVRGVSLTRGGGSIVSRGNGSIISRGGSIKDTLALDLSELSRSSVADTDACSSRRTIDSAGGSTLGSMRMNNKSDEKKKKKKSRRGFGDEVAVARDKRERKMEMAVVKEVVKQSKVIAREQAKAVVKEVTEAAAAAADDDDDDDATTGTRGSKLEKKKSPRRTFKEEAEAARKKVEIQKQIEMELVEKELEARRIERKTAERAMSGRNVTSGMSFERSKSASRLPSSSKHGFGPGRDFMDRSKSCGRELKEDEEDDSVYDVESLWRGGKFKVTETKDYQPPAALLHPVGGKADAADGSDTSARSLKSQGGRLRRRGSSGPGMFSQTICNTLVKLDSMLSLAGSSVVGTTTVRGFKGLTTEVIEEQTMQMPGAGHLNSATGFGALASDAAHPEDSDILRNRPANPSPRCRAMENEIAQKKAEIIKAIAEERESRQLFDRLQADKLRLTEEDVAWKNRVRDANRTTRFLTEEANRMRKYNAELVPLIKGLKIDVWRAKKDRDELRKMSYETADETGQSERLMKWRDWLSDDLVREEVSAGDDNKAMLARLDLRKTFSLFA